MSKKSWKPEELDALRPWATAREEQILDAILTAGSQRKAARVLGIAPRNVMAAVARMKKRGETVQHRRTVHTV